MLMSLLNKESEFLGEPADLETRRENIQKYEMSLDYLVLLKQKGIHTYLLNNIKQGSVMSK